MPSHPSRHSRLRPVHDIGPISGLILAGGAGQRMGGVDKGLQAFEGKPLVASVIARIAPQVDELLISANRHHADYERFGYPVFSDTEPGISPDFGQNLDPYLGPLAGLLKGLKQARHDWLLCVPCDTPRLPLTLRAQLLAGLYTTATPTAPVLVARCGGHAQPTVCLVRRELHAHLAAFLARGERKFGLWQRQVGATYIDFADEQAFANANSPSELAALASINPP